MVNGHIEVIRVKDGKFGNWLSKLYYNDTQDALGSENISAVKSVICAQAVFDGAQKNLYLRTGCMSVINQSTGVTSIQKDVIYYDLINKDWSVIKITANGWSIEESPPILFKRYNSNSMQVMPSKTYPPDIFDQFISLINVKDDSQKLLLKVYIIILFIPEISKVCQILYGEQGAAKTSAQEAIKDLVDPSSVPTLTFPKDNNELIQKLMHNYICYFDNISVIPLWISDQLCRAVTGSGFTERDILRR